jgi:TolB-like protein
MDSKSKKSQIIHLAWMAIILTAAFYLLHKEAGEFSGMPVGDNNRTTRQLLPPGRDTKVPKEVGSPTNIESPKPETRNPIPSTMSTKPTLAVMEFDNRIAKDDSLSGYVRGLRDILRRGIAEWGSCQIVTREKIDAVMRELNLSQQKEFDTETRLRIGRLLGAKYMVFGSVAEILDKYRIEMQIIDVERGVIVALASVAVDHIELSSSRKDALKEKETKLLTDIREKFDKALAARP